jgi:hypothetical protein
MAVEVAHDRSAVRFPGDGPHGRAFHAVVSAGAAMLRGRRRRRAEEICAEVVCSQAEEHNGRFRDTPFGQGLFADFFGPPPWSAKNSQAVGIKYLFSGRR